jgi:hypothetical protein
MTTGSMGMDSGFSKPIYRGAKSIVIRLHNGVLAPLFPGLCGRVSVVIQQGLPESDGVIRYMILKMPDHQLSLGGFYFVRNRAWR